MAGAITGTSLANPVRRGLFSDQVGIRSDHIIGRTRR